MNYNKKRIYIALKGTEEIASFKHNYDAEVYAQSLRNLEKKKHKRKKHRASFFYVVKDVSKFKYWVMDKLGVLD